MNWGSFIALAATISSNTTNTIARLKGGGPALPLGPYAERRKPLWKRYLINVSIASMLILVLGALAGATWGLLGLGRYIGGDVGLAVAGVVACIMWTAVAATALGLDDF